MRSVWRRRRSVIIPRGIASLMPSKLVSIYGVRALSPFVLVWMNGRTARNGFLWPGFPRFESGKIGHWNVLWEINCFTVDTLWIRFGPGWHGITPSTRDPIICSDPLLVINYIVLESEDRDVHIKWGRRVVSGIPMYTDNTNGTYLNLCRLRENRFSQLISGIIIIALLTDKFNKFFRINLGYLFAASKVNYVQIDFAQAPSLSRQLKTR